VWDVVFHTTLTVDRIQHFAWRHFDESDPTHPGREHADIVPSAHRQLDRFLGEALATCDSDARLIVFSDHGHGPRASVGVNLQEIFRRSGLYAIEHRSPARLAVEAGKTAVLSAAPRCHAEGPVIWLARRMPGKAALKSGVFAGRPARGSARVPDLAGSNPYGGIDTGDDDEITARAVEQLNSLRYRGQQVLRWACPTEDIFGTRSAAYPDVLFEFAPQFAPTWNLYGPRFAPIVTRRRLSGGHTRCGVFASNHGQRPAPADSMGVHQALADACRSL
jgi:predicted AlkP superfamily phosphohydrolase/phosphomutase